MKTQNLPRRGDNGGAVSHPTSSSNGRWHKTQIFPSNVTSQSELGFHAEQAIEKIGARGKQDNANLYYQKQARMPNGTQYNSAALNYQINRKQRNLMQHEYERAAPSSENQYNYAIDFNSKGLDKKKAHGFDANDLVKSTRIN